MQRRLILYTLSAGVFLAALLTGPPSFDATDGAEFAVCGSQLQIAHAPGYPLFLMLLRIASAITSPLYGHLRFLNCLIGLMILPLAFFALRRSGASEFSSVMASVLFVTAAPIMSQLNSLEVYPLAIALTLGAIALRSTFLAPYAAGMAVFAGHPASLLCLPLMADVKKWKTPGALTALIPLTLLLYIPIRAGASAIAHYGHPVTLQGLWGYFTMYSGRLFPPSPSRFAEAVSCIGLLPGSIFVFLALLGGKLRFRLDIPILLAVLFLASYQLPDPAGQLWVLLIPLTLRCARGMERIVLTGGRLIWMLLLLVALSAFTGIRDSNRTGDDIGMRWTVDVMSRLPAGTVYRPVAHDTYYAAYAAGILGIREDVILSDPFGNYFELTIPPPAPTSIGEHPVHISRAWDRTSDFHLNGLIFVPLAFQMPDTDWENMEIFHFQGTSPDPMALDVVAEAWARRMIQTEDILQRDSFYRTAVEFASTELTGRRIENLRDI